MSQIRRVAQQLEETYIEMDHPIKIDGLKKRVAGLIEQENQELTFPTIAHYKAYWFNEYIQSKVLSEVCFTRKVMMLQN